MHLATFDVGLHLRLYHVVRIALRLLLHLVVVAQLALTGALEV